MNIFIGEYSTIREVLRQIFIYGCYDRTIGSFNLNISARKYDNELKRLRCFWSDKANRKAKAKSCLNRFLFDGYKDDENYLWRSYCTKAFSPQMLNLNIFLLSILLQKNDLEDGFKTIRDIYYDIDNSCFFLDMDKSSKYRLAYQEITYQMLQRCLDDMMTMGLVECKSRKDGEKIQYRLAKDFLSELTIEDLERLYRVISLWRDVVPLSSLGYNVQRLIGGEIESGRGDELPINNFFKIEDIFFQSILNDEIVYQIMIAIEEERIISIDFFDNEIGFQQVIPLKIICDRLYGRQYLFGLTQNTAFIRRIDRIKSVNFKKKKFSSENFVGYEKILKQVWCASLRNNNVSLKKVEIDFRITKKSERHIFERLKAEKNFGQVEKISERHMIFRVEVLDPYELIPWIRSFGRYAQVRPSKEHDLAKKMQNNLLAMRSAYLNFEGWKKITSPEPIPNRKQQSIPRGNAPKIFCEYRNLIFHAVQEAYNFIILEKDFNKNSLRKLLKNHIVFSGREIDSLVRQVISKGKSIREFSLFKSQKAIMIPTIVENKLDSNTLPFLLTMPEKRWLRTLLCDEIFCSLLGSKLEAKLLRLLEDVKPFPWQSIIIERGFRDNPSLVAPCLKENLKIIFKALQKNRLLEYKNLTASGKEYSGLCKPEKIVYSPYLRSFQLSAINLSDNPEEISLQRMTIANLSELCAVDDNFPITTTTAKLLAKKRRPEILRIAIKPIVSFNDVERAFLLFSTHEKSGYYNETENIYYLDVKFYSFQVNSLIRKILSLGKAAVVLEPEDIRESILRRI